MSTVIDSSSLHKYRTEIPNILFEMDLDPYELSFYLYLKRIAGDHGKCWKANKTMAKESNICVRKIKYLKVTLEQKNLIKVTQRKTENGDQDSSIIEIVDLWPKNFAHFLKPNEDISKSKGVVHNMHDPVHHMPDGGALHAPKEEHIKEEPYKNKEREGALSSKVPLTNQLKERYPHVSTTDLEHLKLEKSLGIQDRDECYKILSDWKEDSPRSKWKKSDYRSITRWVFDALKERRVKQNKQEVDEISNYEYAKNIALKLKNLEGSGRRKMEANAFRAYFEINFIGCENSKPFTLEYTDINFKAKLSEEVKRYKI